MRKLLRPQRRRRGERTDRLGALRSVVALLMLGSASASVLGVVGTSLHQTPPITSMIPSSRAAKAMCA